MPYQSIFAGGNNIPAAKQPQANTITSGFVPGQYAKVNSQIAANQPINLNQFKDPISLHNALKTGQINKQQFQNRLFQIQPPKAGNSNLSFGKTLAGTVAGLPKAAVGMAQGTARAVPELAATAQQLFTPNKDVVYKPTGLAAALVGKQPVQSIQVQAAKAGLSHPGGFHIKGTPITLSPQQTALAELLGKSAQDVTTVAAPIKGLASKASKLKVGAQTAEGALTQPSVLGQAINRAKAIRQAMPNAPKSALDDLAPVEKTASKPAVTAAPAAKAPNEAGMVAPGQIVKDTQAMIDKHQKITNATGNIAEDYAKTQGRATDIKLDVAKVLKNRTTLSTADKQTLQDFRDAKAAGLNPSPLPEHLQQADANITALNKSAQAADAEKARLSGNEAKAQTIEARNPETYTHRIAQGKGSNLELTVRGDTENPLSVGNLSKTTAGSKKQVFMNATDEEGNRNVVAVKQGKVTAFENGQSRDLGNLNPKTNADVMQSELKPVQTKIDSLEREQKTLSATKSRSAAASTRLENIKGNLQDAYRQHADITNKYDMNNLQDKTFKGSDGKRYTLGQATQSEITKHAGQKYYVDPELTSHLNYADSKVSLENTRFVEGTKKILEDKGIAIKDGETAPKGYQRTSSPYFAGYKLQPKVAEVLDDITAGKKSTGGKILGGVSRFLRNTIIYLPIKHDFNMGAGYIVDRGLTSWLNPVAYGRMGKSLAVGAKEVATQGSLYRQILKEGSPLVTADDKALGKVVQRQVRDMLSNQDKVANFAKAFGMSPVRAYKAFQKISVWDVQDVLNIARVHERMQGTLFSGKMNLEDAIKQTQKYNFQYKVPSRVAGSRVASEILQGKTPLTYFGHYTYDKFRIAKNIVKGTGNLSNPKQAFQAADKLAAAVAISAVIWPQVDKELQKITGNKNAHITAPGITAIPETIQQIREGKKSISSAVGSQISVAAPVSLGSQLLGNRDSFTGKQINDPNTPYGQRAEATAKWLLSQMAPAQKLATTKNAPLNKGLSTALSLAGASLPKSSPAANKLDSLKYDSLPSIQAQAKAAAAKGDSRKAIGLIAQYDQQILAQAQKAAKEEGKPMPTAAQLKSAGYYYDPTNATVQSWAKTKTPTNTLTNILNQTTPPKKGEPGYYQYETQKRIKTQQQKTYNRFHPDATKPIL